MTGKSYSEEIVGFPLVPVRRSVHRCDRWDLWIVATHNHTKHQMQVEGYRIQVIDHFHGAGFRAVVKPCEARKHVEVTIGVALQELTHFANVRCIDHDNAGSVTRLYVLAPDRAY